MTELAQYADGELVWSVADELQPGQHLHVALDEQWVAVSRTPLGGGIGRFTLHARADGTELWSVEEQLWGGTSGLGVSPDGLVYLHVSQQLQGNNWSYYGILIEDGVLTTVVDFVPVAPPRLDGWIPGMEKSSWDAPDIDDFGFYEPSLDEWVHVGQVSNHPWVDGEGNAEFLVPGPVPQLTLADPVISDSILLPQLAGETVGVRVRDQDLRIVSAFYQPETYPEEVLVNVATAEVMPIVPSMPPGWTRFPCSRSSGLDGLGRILMPLYDGGVVQLHAWDPGDDSWTAVGRPMTNVASVWFELSPLDTAFETDLGPLRAVKVIGGQCGGLAWDDMNPDAVSCSDLDRCIQVFGSNSNVSEFIFGAGLLKSISVDSTGTCIGWVPNWSTSWIREIGSDEAVSFPGFLESLD